MLTESGAFFRLNKLYLAWRFEPATYDHVERADYHCATHPSILIDAATPICLAYSFCALMASWENKACIIYSAAFTYITHSTFFLRHRLVFSVTGNLLWLLVNFPGQTEVSQMLYKTALIISVIQSEEFYEHRNSPQHYVLGYAVR